MFMEKEKLFLIDAHALCYRAFYAIRGLATSKGQATNAVFGFVNILKKILKTFEPVYVAVCFDSKEKTKRQEQFASYKIQRPKMPDDLISQIPLIKKAVDAFHIPQFELAGYEADDLIATIAEKAKKAHMEVVIISDDKDMYQLAHEGITFYSSKKDAVVTGNELKEEWGFAPQQMTDFIALAGDSVDNIPGVTGVGEVTARQLISRFRDLDHIYRHIDDIEKPKLREKLLAGKDQAYLSKELATLELEAPITFDLKGLRIGEPDKETLYKFFRELEFKKLAQEFALETPAVEKRTSKPSISEKEVAQWIKKNSSEEIFVLLSVPFEKDDLFGEPSLLMFSEKDEGFTLESKKISWLAKFFENKSTKIVTHNVKPLLKVLDKGGCCLEGQVFDVMLSGYLLSPSRSYELEDFAWEYFKESAGERPSDEQKKEWLKKLYHLFKEELKSKKLASLYEDIELPLSFVLFDMEKEGVNIDVAFLNNLSKECDRKITELTRQLYKQAEGEFNLNSPKQLGTVLFEKLKLRVVKRTKTGYSTDEEVLTTLAAEHEFPSLLLEYRQLAKLKSTYIDALPKMVDERDGHIHAEFDQIGAETGRLSSRNPNLQNIPVRTELGRQIRKAIIASDKNHVIVAADYSQVELRILAHLSKDENLKKAFQKEDDIHRYTSSLIFDVDEKEVTKEMRYAAKRINFGIIYGMSAFGLSKDLKISPAEAQQFIDKYFARYPKIKAFMDKQIKECEEKGYVTTLLNRRRYIPEIKSDNKTVRQFAQRQAINTPVQGSAADLIKLAMIHIHKALQEKKLSTRMIMTVHDELVFDAPRAELKEAAKLIKKAMEEPLKLDVPLKATLQAGVNWLDLKDVST